MLSGLPDSVKAIAIVLIAVVPGACFVWGYERVRRRRQGPLTIEGQSLEGSERVLLFVLAATGHHLIFGWIEYLAWHHWFRNPADLSPGLFALAWVGGVSAVVLPSVAGWVGGRVWPMAVKRSDAWTAALADLDLGFLVVTTTDGNTVAGRFGGTSVAGVGPNRDIYLEEYEMTDEGALMSPRGYGVFVPSSSIVRVALVPETQPNGQC